jgi:ArsR family transcriptional regulator
MEMCWLLVQGERTVSGIVEELGLSQSLVSHHLAALREVGLVEARRDGSWMVYRLRPEPLAAATEELGGLVEAWERRWEPKARRGTHAAR